MLVTDASIMQPDRSRNQDSNSHESNVELTVNIRQVQQRNLIQALKNFLTVLLIRFSVKVQVEFRQDTQMGDRKN